MNGHLDAEAHSAALDGQATAGERAHLDTCPACRAEVERLAGVARAVGVPVAAQPRAEADAALARALAAAEPASRVVPISSRPSRTSRRLRLDARSVLAAAAILLVVAVGATLVGRTTASHPHATASSRLPAVGGTGADRAASTTIQIPVGAAAGPPYPGISPAGAPASAASRSPAGAAGPAVVDGGDLGAQSAVGPLVTIVQSALDGERTTPPPAAGQPALAQPTATCAASAATVSPVPLARLLYVATTTWKGTPAIVLGEQAATAPGGRPGPSRLVLVLAREGCGLLASQGF
jgi:hypothetical protein